MQREVPQDSGWMGDRSRGAGMGRVDTRPAAWSGKVCMTKVRLNQGGYDSGGAYWGVAEPLYWAASDDGELDLWFRAESREAAKAHVRSLYLGARFYR
jgi:hypothetical protein